MSSSSNSNSKPTLRETALKTNKTNPSQLGDPISLKAETSDTSPTPQDNPSSPNASPHPSMRNAVQKDSSEDGNGAASSKHQSAKSDIGKVAPAPTEGDVEISGKGKGKGDDGHKTLRQRAMDKLDENPSQLGDPISLKAETADSEPTENDRGAGDKPRSKL